MPKKIRSYYSLVRQRQADETRIRIAEGARALILSQGYRSATMEGIGRQAGVATPTVYAVFGSKRRILKELVDRAAFGPAYQKLLALAQSLADPIDRLKMAPRFARQIYDAEQTEMGALRKAGVAAEELNAIERENECSRYEGQAPTIIQLNESGRLKPTLEEKTARDILWTLTSRDVYRMLVIERNWSSDQYEEWLRQSVLASLLKIFPTTLPSKGTRPGKKVG